MSKHTSFRSATIVAAALLVLLPAVGLAETARLPETMSSLLSQALFGESAVEHPTATAAKGERCASPRLVPELMFAPEPLGASCASQCRDTYFSCLDDCVTAPFPGCADFCRFDVLYPCYKACF